jgi:hypothetical protein
MAWPGNERTPRDEADVPLNGSRPPCQLKLPSYAHHPMVITTLPSGLADS